MKGTLTIPPMSRSEFYEAMYKQDLPKALAAIKELEEKLKVATEALTNARNELSVPQPGYPAPVANAAYLICEALEKLK